MRTLRRALGLVLAMVGVVALLTVPALA
ncbi:MAG: hypothetical protein H6Q86_2765, partial [candidate division NC10 bacterium]|nr:hypothetical protein [candidate division NC10 bacterium]